MLQPVGTVTGRLVDQSGKPLAGLSFPIAYDDGPGRPGVYFSGGGFRYRFSTQAESSRQQRISQFALDKRIYLVGPEKSDDQGRFRITGLFPGVAFDLKVMLTRTEPDPGNPKQNREIIVGMVKVARPTLKAGEVHDLGDLKVGQAVEKEP